MTTTAAPDPRAVEGPRDGGLRVVCPSCRVGLERISPRRRAALGVAPQAGRSGPEIPLRAPALTCPSCRSSYARVSGIVDFRIAPDRYLSLAEDRDKAARLDAATRGADFPVAAAAYYAMTADVDEARRSLYLAHLARAEARGAAMAAQLPRSGPTLEIGCGSGGLLKAASRRGIAIQGIDIALRWLVLARRRFPEALVIAANAEALPWADGSFACVAADSVLEHLNDPVAALREWHRVARPGGRLVVWSPNRFSLLPDPHVGLFGLGWMPRSWQARYVRLRRGCDWPIRVRSASEAARLAREAGWTSIRVEPAPAPGDRAVLRWYDALRKRRSASAVLRAIGPLWQMTARRGIDA